MEKATDEPSKRGRGRPEGSTSKLTRESIERAKEMGLLPHEWLLRVMHGEVIMRRKVDKDGVITEVQESYDFDKRVDAAKAAAPFFAPKISTVEVIHGVSDEQLNEFIARAAAEAGLSVGAGGEGAQDAGSSGGTSSAGRSGKRERVLHR